MPLGVPSPGMESSEPALQVTALQVCLRDLVSILALPSFCRGRSQREALTIVVDSARTLLRADLAYARLKPPQEGVETFWFADSAFPVEKMRALVAPSLEAKSSSVTTIPSPSGGASLRLAFVPIGFFAESGALVLGSTRADFPLPLELLLAQAIGSVTGSLLDSAHLLDISRESDRRKDEFMALLGHELRNPLAPILTALELMKLRNVGAEKERAIIERQSHHMVRLIDDLLDVSRITRGRVELDKKDIAVSEVAARAVEMAAPLIEKNKHVLRVEVDPELHVNGDVIRLAQVFSNLLANSARYTPPGGRIELIARRAGDVVEIRVRDNGRGLEPEMLEKIFVPFFQTDRKKDALSGGLGLGLALVKNLVELHGGTVCASSEGRGLGAVLLVTLPRALESATAVPAPDPSPQQAKSIGLRRVLVVDDSHDAANLLADALRILGQDVRVAHDGAGALSALSNGFNPEFAILDLGMPGMDGYELATRMRAAAPKTVLVALSGYTEDGAREKSLAAGFAHHLAKPVELGVVTQILSGGGD